MEVFLLELIGFRNQALRALNNHLFGVACNAFKTLFEFCQRNLLYITYFLYRHTQIHQKPIQTSRVDSLASKKDIGLSELSKSTCFLASFGHLLTRFPKSQTYSFIKIMVYAKFGKYAYKSSSSSLDDT